MNTEPISMTVMGKSIEEPKIPVIKDKEDLRQIVLNGLKNENPPVNRLMKGLTQDYEGKLWIPNISEFYRLMFTIELGKEIFGDDYFRNTDTFDEYKLFVLNKIYDACKKYDPEGHAFGF